MQRSSSSNRVTEDFFNTDNRDLTSTTRASAEDTDKDQQHQYLLLPTYDPLSHAARKERLRLRYAKNAVHVIPLVLVLCAIILWFFSNPESRV